MGSSAFTHRLRLAWPALFSTTTSTECLPSLSLGSVSTENRVSLASLAQLGTRATTESGQVASKGALMLSPGQRTVAVALEPESTWSTKVEPLVDM